MELNQEHPAPGHPAQPLINNNVLTENIAKIHPDKDKIYDRDYFLHYNRGSKSDFKVFHFDGTFPGAVQRAKDHCKIMNIRFLYITPFVTDLEYQETQQLTGQG